MNYFAYLAVMVLTTYLLRVLPLTLVRGNIKSDFLRSFLYYVPCACLAAMTFPAILYATNSMLSGLFAFLVALILSYKELSMPAVAAMSCLAAFACEMLARYL